MWAFKLLILFWLRNQWWILQLRTMKSSVQNDALDGRQWIQGPWVLSDSSNSKYFKISLRTLFADNWSFCAKRSEAKSQNLIVILRTVKRSFRIYCRTRDGFCNSGQRCPLCRMTGWMADNVLKNTQFYQIHQLPKKSRFFHQLSLLTPSFCAKQSWVAESIA